MKKVMFIVLLAVQSNFAQNTFPQSGNVGIGILNANAMLTIGGSSPLFLNNGASSSTPFLAVLNSV